MVSADLHIVERHHLKRIAIVGWSEGYAGQIHSWIERACDCHVAYFVHPEDQPPNKNRAEVLRGRAARRFDVPTNSEFRGVPLISARDWPAALLELGITSALITTDHERTRSLHIDQAKLGGIALVNAIHPSALIMDEAIIEENVICFARAIVGYRAELHAGAIVNTGSQLDHHNLVRRCATIDPGVVAAGSVTFNHFCHVNPGVVLGKRVTVGEDAIIAAGAVVIRDVAPRTFVMGVPAKAVRSW